MLAVQIVTPRKVAWSGEAADVRAPGSEGEFGVLPGHIPFLTTLKAGIVTVNAAGGTKRFSTGPGFAEAGPERIVLLVDSCEEQA